MVLPRSVHYYTLQEYYALERAAEYKSEYFDGEIFPLGGIVGMAGGTSRHSLISMNLSGCLVLALRGKRCAAYNSDQRVKVKSTGLCTYPDASVFCGRLEYDLDDEQKETATNPTAVFEVLSESTEAYDRGTKATQFRSIESLQAYVLVSQHEAHIEHFGRGEDGRWVLTEAKGLDATLSVPSQRSCYHSQKFMTAWSSRNIRRSRS